jgi:hypothetical protein
MRRALLVLLTGGAVSAGPPAICWRVEIGDAKSLPWGGDDSFATEKGYDSGRVVGDTLALLDGTMPVIVRMETLRRATVYLEESAAGRDALLRALMARVLDAEALGKPSALAWFDAGYAKGCFSQMRDHGPGGYTWVKRANELAGGSAEMEYACCLLSLMSDRAAFMGHLEKAAAGAPNNALLAKNLDHMKELYPPVLKYFEEKEKGMGRGKGKGEGGGKE